mmetsp:Transcript_9516/g.15790  ORF Transcript_9516/g.15790 Transcript_9516/m.15790 type:complete len:732 (+) Transcript_9516:165-2360(+)
MSQTMEEILRFNSTTAIKETFDFDPTEHYRTVSNDFQEFHLDPVNVIMHFVTTPLGLIGVFSIMRSYTTSSSMAMFLLSMYLVSLLPALPNGVFVGTALLCGLIVFTARQAKLSFLTSVFMIVIGYMMQDMAHLATGEKTYQSTYSDGGQIDLANPLQWAWMFVEHVYYLLPLCVHVALPFLTVPAEIKSVLEAPLPDQVQRLHAFAWLLGPLACCALGSYCLDSKNQFCFFPGAPYFHRVLQCNLQDTSEKDASIIGPTEKDGGSSSSSSSSAGKNRAGKKVDPRSFESNSVTHNGNGRFHESRKADMDMIRSWALSHSPPENMSSHWWYTDLAGKAKQAFDNCAHSTQIESMFRSLFSRRNYCLDVVTGMNEIYISGPSRFEEAGNSDNVFYTRHVDGPFGLLPFVSVYRCIVGLDRNEKITTHFPLANIDKNAMTGDVLAFDFNREVHYISADESKTESSDKQRVVLKLHYCIYPRVLAPIGWLMHHLNTNYNMSFRALFLKTINPNTLYEHFLAWNVNFNTILYDRIETLIGLRNLTYLASMLALWYVTGVYEIFLAFTSYVHYFRYISTYYVRRGIDFGSFKRDVLVMKSVALLQLFYHYLFPTTTTFEFDFISIAMIVAGYVVSVMATEAIGIDRTYFGSELGLVEPKWIDQFPYGYIPHPMIVSQVCALLGFYKAAHYRAEWPYVVPIHIGMYLLHMLQEHFDIYKRYPEDAPVTAISAFKKNE